MVRQNTEFNMLAPLAGCLTGRLLTLAFSFHCTRKAVLSKRISAQAPGNRDVYS
jgi:hypothetical protein